MAKILITYDLNQPGRDYPRITERIKAIGPNWCHPLESVWLIVINATPEQVRDDLTNYCDSSSRLLVLDVTGDSMAWVGLPADAAAWLKAN